MESGCPRSPGIEAARQLKEVAPSAKIVMLTTRRRGKRTSSRRSARARAGLPAHGHSADELATGAAVYGGQVPDQPSRRAAATEFATLDRRAAEDEPPKHAPARQLTEREEGVIRPGARGMNNRDLAKELFIF